MWVPPCLPVLGGASHDLRSGKDEREPRPLTGALSLPPSECSCTREGAFQGGPQAGSTSDHPGDLKLPSWARNPEAGQPLERLHRPECSGLRGGVGSCSLRGTQLIKPQDLNRHLEPAREPMPRTQHPTSLPGTRKRPRSQAEHPPTPASEHPHAPRLQST